MNQLKKLIVAQFKMTFREKQVWFWSILYPVFLLVIFLTIFGGFIEDDEQDFQVTIAIVEEQPTTLPELKHALSQVPVFEWKDEQPVSREQAEEWVKDKKVDAVIVLPHIVDDQNIELIFNAEKENSTTVQAMTGIVNEMIHHINYQLAGYVPQIKITSQYISSAGENIRYTDFLLTGLIALSISQAGMFGLVVLVEMRRNGMLKRLRMTPVNMSLYGFSHILVRFILSAIQVTLLVLVGLLVYNANLNIDFLSFILIFTMGTLSFTAIGFFVASVSKSMDSFFGLTNIISFIMMFLSGIFFDYSMLPSYLKPLADVLPLTYFANGIRDSMVYGIGIWSAEFWMNMGILALWAIVVFALGTRFYRWKAEMK